MECFILPPCRRLSDVVTRQLMEIGALDAPGLGPYEPTSARIYVRACIVGDMAR